MIGVFESLTREIRYAARSLGRSPALVATVLATVALGLGVNGALFAVLDVLLFRAPPGVSVATELARVRVQYRGSDGVNREADGIGLPDLEDFQRMAGITAVIEGYRLEPRSHRDANGSLISTAYVTRGYFDVLGVRPHRGRFFLPEDMRIGSPSRTAILSHAYWKARFGADQDVVGKQLFVDSVPLMIVGVAAPGFEGLDLDAIQMWLPISMLGALQSEGEAPQGSRRMPLNLLRHRPILAPVLRLTDGSSHGALSQALTRAYRSTAPANRAQDSTAVISINSLVTARTKAGNATGAMGVDSHRLALLKMLAGLALAGIATCVANIAGLLLLRVIRRQEEFGIKAALGASRARIRTQIVLESVLLALVGGAIALWLTLVGADALRRALLYDVHWTTSVLSGRLIAAVMFGAGAVGFAAGILPAFASKGLLNPALLRIGRPAHGRGVRRQTAILLVIQASVCGTVLIASGFFVQSLKSAVQMDLGFAADSLLEIEAFGMDRSVAQGVLPELRSRVAEIPSVKGVSIAAGPILSGMPGTFLLTRSNGDSVHAELVRRTTANLVEPDYFRVAGLSVIAGRAISASDVEGAPPVMLISRTMAGAYWPRGGAVGDCLFLFPEAFGPCVTVVGIAEDARADLAGEFPLRFYMPLAQSPLKYYMHAGFPSYMGTHLLVKVEAGWDAPSAAIRALVDQYGAAANWNLGTVRSKLEPEVRPWRVAAVLLSVLGLITIVLAAIGIYGAIAHEAERRTRDFGVMLAIGASPLDVIRLLFSVGIKPVALGCIIGASVAFMLLPLVKPLLFDQSHSSTAPIIAGIAALIITSCLAVLVPARRAAAIDPSSALRSG